MARKPNLLLCFDAFGTLFRPKHSVAQQYGDVARQCGLSSRLREEDVQPCLMAAMKAESKRNPNFGRATGLGATKWWTNVIHNTFAPLLAGTGASIPDDLAPRLLHRFATMDGYTLESPDLVSSLRSLKGTPPPAPPRTASVDGAASGQGVQRGPLYDQIVVGIVTNSDDRVPGILSSAGFAVSPLRYGTELGDPAEMTAIVDADGNDLTDWDIDFHCMSYDVGVAKPDLAIFEAADYMLPRVLDARSTAALSHAEAHQAWQKIYVGDEYAKDVVGSLSAGWNSVLLDHEGSGSDTHEGQAIPILQDVGETTTSITDLFKESPVLSVRSIKDLVRCLRGY
ncbi:hypothetical protein Micbo1qcDRAFT_237089 [Microdochium bolleyi]|uniref:Haloacid dehalogenase n=1 Tax=Microdochium bolleyi TaxID=196109 RepID=A0A136IMJ5_9PEZI|nr:hypothetical protein Micbo1qcDRAFT_237089 [Microdochium bolleyi]